MIFLANFETLEMTMFKIIIVIAIVFIIYNIASIGLEKDESDKQIFPNIEDKNENRKRNSKQD